MTEIIDIIPFIPCTVSLSEIVELLRNENKVLLIRIKSSENSITNY